MKVFIMHLYIHAHKIKEEVGVHLSLFEWVCGWKHLSVLRSFYIFIQ